MACTLSERLFAHVVRLPLSFHLQRETGAITQALQNGLRGYQMALHTLVFVVLPVAVEIATVLFVLWAMAPTAFLLLFCGAIVCYSLAFIVAAKRVAPVARAASVAEVEANARITDQLLNCEGIKHFSAETMADASVGGAVVKVEESWVRFFRKFTANGLGVATIYASFLAVTILYAAREVQAGDITVGTFVLINTYMLQLVRPVEQIGLSMQNMSQAAAFLDQLLGLFQQKTEVLSEHAAPHSGPGKLELRSVRLSYGPDRQILRGVSFEVPAGKTIGIVGASGSGKSTVWRLITRLLEPDSGVILLDGIPIKSLDLTALRRSIAIVPQDTTLLNDTIARNIAFGRAGSSQADIERAAKLARIHDFISRLPQGYETSVGERGVRLSGGERQRIAIARAVIKEPRIYVFDEATSSLDSTTEQEILENLREISRTATTLLIAHRLSTVVHADEIVVLEGGVVRERGTHVSLAQSGGLYSAFWESQQAVGAGQRSVAGTGA